jgi:polysaccharide export outer membrane protein
VQTKGKAQKADGSAQTRGRGLPVAPNIQDKPYEIGPEDIISVNVLHQADVSQQLVVRPDGFITVRFAGEIKADGLTTQQLADVITEKLTTYFNHPEVIIQIVKINSKKFYVAGQIKRPGSYTLGTPKTVLEAIIEAGGPADFAKTKGIYILRGLQRIPFNYNDVSKGKNLDQNILLQNGDVIQIP